MASYDGVPYVDQHFASIDFGSTFTGFMLQLFLYGNFISLFFDYLATKNYARDSRRNRALIWTVVVLNTASTALAAYLMLYHGCNQDRGIDSVYQITMPDQMLTVPLGLIGCITQSFLALRASKLFKRHATLRALFLSIVFLMLSVAFVACTLLPVLTTAFAQDWNSLFGPITYNVAATIWLWLSASVDLILTCSLILCLRRSVLGFNPSTDSAIRGIICAALQSAVPTAVFALAGAVLCISWGTEDGMYSIMYQLPTIPLASLYSLSLLTTLSSRKPIERSSKAVVGPHCWWNRSADSPATPGSSVQRKQKKKQKKVLAVGVMSQTTGEVGSPIALGITFTRDVIEEVEAGEEELPSARGRPSSESDQERTEHL